MKAVILRAHGGADQLRYEEVDPPRIGPDQVLVRVRAVSVNRTLDIEVRERGAGFGVKLPHITGADPVGEVAAVGASVRGVREGDRVAAYPFLTCQACECCTRGEENACVALRVIGVHAWGGYAEYVALPERNVLPLPAGLPFEEAAAVPLSYSVAWHLLTARGRVKPGETVLVLAAGSGLGIAGIQIAKLCGARVIAAAGTDEKLTRAKALGADAGVNYAREGWSQDVRRLTGDRGVDLVYENVGAATWSQSLACLARQGRVVTCGTHGGNLAEIDIRSLYRHQISLLFSAGSTRAEAEEVLRQVGAGKLRAVVDRVFPLAQAPAAQQHVLDRRNFGKVILTP
ncbi:MAG: zinc-binding dehydrogenase [Deltaproteobacteria bacterium]|nr:zinc-binding dehydrogenase [Deltaproteobacteria bacterium]